MHLQVGPFTEKLGAEWGICVVDSEREPSRMDIFENSEGPIPVYTCGGSFRTSGSTLGSF